MQDNEGGDGAKVVLDSTPKTITPTVTVTSAAALPFAMTSMVASSPISREKSSMQPQNGVSQVSPRPGISFQPGSKLEAKDFTDKWYSATVVETDWNEKEVLIHFDKWSSRFDEWIALDSPRLRALPILGKENPKKVFMVGDRVSATWVDGKKYPATVNAVLEIDKYDVLFDDGYAKILKSSKMTRIFHKPLIPAGGTLDEHANYQNYQYHLGTKQERREKKRKHLVSELFTSKKKFSKLDSSDPPGARLSDSSSLVHNTLNAKNSEGDQNSLSEASKYVLASDGSSKPKVPARKIKKSFEVPPWLGKFNEEEFSVYEEETINGIRKSLKVQDKKLPEGWEKHIVQRKTGCSAGKWDVLFLHSGTGKKFRSRNDIRSFMESQGQTIFDPSMFDFCVHPKNRNKPKGDETASRKVRNFLPKARHLKPSSVLAKPLPTDNNLTIMSTSVPCTGEQSYDNNATFIGDLRVEIADGYFRCPVDGCFKNFRKENLLQMHIKHYHPEYSKFVGSTPNVADLAYARTIGESLTDVIIPKRPKSCSTPFQQTVQLHALQSSLQGTTEVPSDKSQAHGTLVKDTSPMMSDNLKSEENNLSNLDDSIDRSSSCTMSPTALFDRQNEDRVHTGIRTLAPLRPPPLDHADQSLIESSTSYEPPCKVKKMKFESELQDFDSNCTDENLSSHDDTTVDFSLKSKHHSTDSQVSETNKFEKLRKEEIINCTCNMMEEDGLMIQCDLCLCWQHGYCNGIEKDTDVPEKYVCYTCQNPFRERLSHRYIHDQDWINEGKLPVLAEHRRHDPRKDARAAKLKRSFDMVNGLLQIQEVLHSLRVKVNVAQNKSHPKLYLWAKSWKIPEIPNLELTPVPVMEIKKEEQSSLDLDSNLVDPKMAINGRDEINQKLISSDTELMKILEEGDNNQKLLNESASDQLIVTSLKALPPKIAQILTQVTDTKIIYKSLPPVVPQPEAPIDPLECKLRLLEHIDNSQNYVNTLLNFIEVQVCTLEEMDDEKVAENSPLDHETQVTWKQTIRMLLNDLETVRRMAALCPTQV